MPPTPIAKLTLTALDCPDPRALAAFYASITGWPVSSDSDDDWVWLESDVGTTLAFQRSPDHRPPTWPGGERPQQLHLDFDVPGHPQQQAWLSAGSEGVPHREE